MIEHFQRDLIETEHYQIDLLDVELFQSRNIYTIYIYMCTCT